MKKIVLAIMLVMVSLVGTANALIIGSGIKLDPNGIETSIGTEFVGVNNHLLFIFSENKLEVSNNDGSVALWWLNFGKYTFSGLDNVTSIKLVDNDKFHGTILNPKFTSDSITFNMQSGNFGFDTDGDQHLTFDVGYTYHRYSTPYGAIEVVAPVPEPATMMLFGAGILGIVGAVRFKKE